MREGIFSMKDHYTFVFYDEEYAKSPSSFNGKNNANIINMDNNGLRSYLNTYGDKALEDAFIILKNGEQVSKHDIKHDIHKNERLDKLFQNYDPFGE